MGTSNLTIWLVSKNPWFVHHSNHVDLDCTIENDLFYLNNRLPQGRHHYYLPDFVPFWDLSRKSYQCRPVGTVPHQTHLKLDFDSESSLEDLNQIVNNIHIFAVHTVLHRFLEKMFSPHFTKCTFIYESWSVLIQNSGPVWVRYPRYTNIKIFLAIKKLTWKLTLLNNFAFICPVLSFAWSIKGSYDAQWLYKLKIW